MAVAQLLHVQLCTPGCKKWSLLAKISGLDGIHPLSLQRCLNAISAWWFQQVRFLQGGLVSSSYRLSPVMETLTRPLPV
jgi:cellulose synthase/poly-beta-1,6-N-acetylglucosamine synthase-like glycosyltransferase